MATTKKKGLPEMVVTAEQNPDLIAKAKEALRLRAQIAELEAQETALKKSIAEEANALRKTEETTKGQYIGNVKIVDGDQQSSQVQFKVMSSLISLGLDQEATLDHLYGSSRALLFGKHTLGMIRDHIALWMSSVPRAKILWTCLMLRSSRAWTGHSLEVRTWPSKSSSCLWKGSLPHRMS
jgi:hypothetical protein